MQTDKATFKKLLGDSMIFFNKDANQVDSYKARPKAISHIENCPCNECKRNRHSEEVRNLLNGLGAY